MAIINGNSPLGLLCLISQTSSTARVYESLPILVWSELTLQGCDLRERGFILPQFNCISNQGVCVFFLILILILRYQLDLPDIFSSVSYNEWRLPYVELEHKMHSELLIISTFQFSSFQKFFLTI